MSAKYYGTEKIGETFEYNGKTYKVMTDERYRGVCFKCAFNKSSVSGCNKMKCLPFKREDGKNVYYIEVSQ